MPRFPQDIEGDSLTDGTCHLLWVSVCSETGICIGGTFEEVPIMALGLCVQSRPLDGLILAVDFLKHAQLFPHFRLHEHHFML